MSLNSIFKKYSLEPNQSETIEFGEQYILLKHIDKGWYINVTDNPDSSIAEDGEFYQTGSSNSLVFSPALQDKPLVFKSNKMSILPEQSLTFFVKIPLVLQVYYSRKKDENLIREIQSKELSNTWFGEVDKGELAYSIGSEFSLSTEAAGLSAYEAICPVRVYNNSKTMLEIQRLILRVNHLSLYKNRDNLITDLIKIEYKSKESVSSAEYTYSKSIHGEKETVVTKPREINSLAQLKKNFHFIKNIYRSI